MQKNVSGCNAAACSPNPGLGVANVTFYINPEEPRTTISFSHGKKKRFPQKQKNVGEGISNLPPFYFYMPFKWFVKQRGQGVPMAGQSQYLWF